MSPRLFRIGDHVNDAGENRGTMLRTIDRDCILRMKAEGNSLRVIATMLGVGYGTVRMRLQ